MERRGVDPGDLREWLAYLRDIGVHELVAPAPAARRPGVLASRRADEGTLAAEPLPGAATRTRPARGVPPPTDSVPWRRPEAEARAARSTTRKPESSPGRQEQGASTPPAGSSEPPAGFAGPAPADPVAALATVRGDLGDCTRCKLHSGRTKIVFGVGNPKARLMFVGEGPGRDEDLKGEPFVGRAGQKLDEMIRAIGLERADVYIANIVKCRPPNNRDPEPDEVETCSPFLFRQIETIRPRVIVTLGGPATKLMLKTKVGITRLRGSWHDYRGIPLMPTFHPAFVLRNYTKETRMRVWEDLKAARERMGEPR